MIYLNADLHGDFSPLYEFANSERGKHLGKNDFVIILGDFGIDYLTLEEIKQMDGKLPFTLMFLDGNHENFDLLGSMTESMAYGGRVHNIGGVYHLCRGEVFSLPCKEKNVTIAVCGGGDSRDKEYRVPGVSWFEAEAITNDDVNNLKNNLEKWNFTVDYFLSHVMSSAVKIECYTQSLAFSKKGISSMIPEPSEYKIRDMIGFTKAKKYFSGHEHVQTQYHLLDKTSILLWGDFYLLEE